MNPRNFVLACLLCLVLSGGNFFAVWEAGPLATQAPLYNAVAWLCGAGLMIYASLRSAPEIVAATSRLGSSEAAKNVERQLEKSRLEVARLQRELDQVPSQRTAPVVLPPVAPARADTTRAELVGFLSLLQRKGRLVDFVMDDIARYDDAQVGAAARVVHQGCGEVLKEYFQIEPVRSDEEGNSITVDSEYDPARYLLVGRVAGNPPFKGTLIHRGWRTTKVGLPELVNADGAHRTSFEIIAPAEVEINA